MTASSRAEGSVDRDCARRVSECDKHGPYDSTLLYRDLWSRCPACSEEMTRLREENYRASEAARLAERQRHWLAESGLRGRFLDATFSTFVPGDKKQATVLKACQSYVETLDTSTWRPLWLIGPPGTGKTHLGAAMVQACIAVRQRDAWVDTPRGIVRNLRSTWRKDSDTSEDAVIDAYGAVPLLVLDEVGVGFGSDGELVQLFEVIDRRYQMRRPTVLISNLAAKDLRTALGDRIFDRLREGATVLVCNWTSHRGRVSE